MPTSIGVSRKEKLATLCEAHGLQLLYAFGSRATEAMKLHDGSRNSLSRSSADLDIGIKPSGTLGIREKASIAVELEDLFGASRVDLVLLPEADPFLAANIIRGERLYAENEHAGAEYELYILRRAGDLAPLERERLALLEKR
jgi:predicted nucleotidyltransferase